jgi:lipoate-protein ligase A
MSGSLTRAPWCIVEEVLPPAGISEPAWNMGLDAFNLECVLANSAIPLMRLYEWTAPGITLGRFQDPDRSVDREACRWLNIPIARRPTGGRGILHGSDLTVSLAISLAGLGLSNTTSITDIYGSLSATLVGAFTAVGLDAARGMCASHERGYSANCMATVSRADVVLRTSGDKLLGGALLRKADCILFQCTIFANIDTAHWNQMQSRVFQGPLRSNRCPPPVIAVDDLRRAIKTETAMRFGRQPDPHRLSACDVKTVAVQSINRQILI